MQRFTAILVVRNEAPYLLEWIAHHLAVGFTDIVLCTWDCSDGTVKMARRLASMGYVHRHNLDPSSGDVLVSALEQVADFEEVVAADWLYVSRANAFLTVQREGGFLEDLVSGETGTLHLKSRKFGSADITEFDDVLVTRRFVQAGFKSVLEGKLVRSPAGFKQVGTEVQATRNIYTRSKESFLLSSQFSRLEPMSRAELELAWQAGNQNVERHENAFSYINWFDKYHRYLVEDGRLSKIHAAAVEWHQVRIKELRDNPEFAGFLDAPL